MSASVNSQNNPDQQLDQQALLEENRRLKASLAQLREEVSELKRLIFGSKRERFVPAVDDRQLCLELERPAATAEEPALVKQTVSYQRAIKQATKTATRQPFPAHLPRIEIIIEPEEDVSGMRKIGEEITEELDLTPARLLGSCKLQDIDPYQYLQDVLERLPEHPVNQLKELLPPNWKPANIEPISS